MRICAPEQAIPFFQEALGRLDGVADSEGQKRKVVELLFDLEVLYDQLARREDQRATLERLIHSTMALDDPVLLADAYIRQGELLSVVESAENALTCVEQALNLKRLIGDKRGEAKALRAMGFIYWQRGQYEEALHIHREVLQIHRALGDRETEGMELTNLGELLRQLHRYQEALQCLEEAVQLLTALGNLMELAVCHYNLGNVYRDLEAYEMALHHYLKSEELGAAGPAGSPRQPSITRTVDRSRASPRYTVSSGITGKRCTIIGKRWRSVGRSGTGPTWSRPSGALQ